MESIIVFYFFLQDSIFTPRKTDFLFFYAVARMHRKHSHQTWKQFLCTFICHFEMLFLLKFITERMRMKRQSAHIFSCTCNFRYSLEGTFAPKSTYAKNCGWRSKQMNNISFFCRKNYIVYLFREWWVCADDDEDDDEQHILKTTIANAIHQRKRNTPTKKKT